jgi:hypothetical protein
MTAKIKKFTKVYFDNLLMIGAIILVGVIIKALTIGITHAILYWVIGVLVVSLILTVFDFAVFKNVRRK